MVKPAVYCCCSVVDELAAMIALETNTSWDRWEPDFCFGAYSGQDDSPRHNNINDELKHRGIVVVVVVIPYAVCVGTYLSIHC